MWVDHCLSRVSQSYWVFFPNSMGCICTKPVVQKPASPGFGFSGMIIGDGQAGTLGSSLKNQFELDKINNVEECESYSSRGSRKLKKCNSKEKGSLSFRLSFSNRHAVAEQAAAGWPSWLTSVAGEAIEGWIPLKADSFEKLEKIGQGTYSSVFRARELETGKMFALKKVRFDNFQPESIRFMAREIMILRRLEHPNIMKLEGIITSRLSSTIYLVFEYMEHDLAGLISCPAVKFTDSQVKCYMKQLLFGLEHCHLHGVIHRDIKASNILINNEGILKLGDFGLANVLSSKGGQQLTSRVVTLWYRPPELLMGSTNYGVSVDLWSVGCVFAEILFRRPILKGRTEVEQLHKIFKLCGSPPEDYWKMSKIPHATMFKPQHFYESSLREKFKDVPTCAVNLMENLLSVEPYKRGTASSALMSEYFRTPPYACDPSSLPKYPPNKEIDAKHREEARRKRSRARLRETEATRKATGTRKTLESNNFKKLAPKEEVQDGTRHVRRNNGGDAKAKFFEATKEPLKLSIDATSGISEVTSVSQGQSIFSGPIPVTGSSNFAWVKRRKDDALLERSYSRSGSRSQVSAFDSSSIIFEDGAVGIDEKDIRERRKVGSDFDRPDCFDSSELYCSQDFDMGPNVRERANEAGDKDHNSNIEFSGPILSRTRNIEELLQRNEQHIRRAVRRTRLHREDVIS